MRRTFVLLLLIFLHPLLSGYVAPADKTIEAARKATPEGPVRFRAAWNGVTGHLDVVGPGLHRFQADDGHLVADPGYYDQWSRTNQSLWRFLDFYSPQNAEELFDGLLASGIDMHRRGWVRLDREGDHLALTLGAMGESEPDMPQVWFDEQTGRAAVMKLKRAAASSY